MSSKKVDLTKEEIESLAWACVAVSSEQSSKGRYDEHSMHLLTEMSFVRHKILDYQLDQDVTPLNIDDVDREINNCFFPETKDEIAWGVRSVTHRKLNVEVDESCEEQVWVTNAGRIMFNDIQQETE